MLVAKDVTTRKRAEDIIGLSPLSWRLPINQPGRNFLMDRSTFVSANKTGSSDGAARALPPGIIEELYALGGVLCFLRSFASEAREQQNE